MEKEKNIELVMKFLKSNYPVSRIKVKDRFKRGIIADGGQVFYLNNKNVYAELKIHLKQSLYIVFNLDFKSSDEILNTYLNL